MYKLGSLHETTIWEDAKIYFPIFTHCGIMDTQYLEGVIIMVQSMNFHTHSCFCDGKNTPEEMVQEAIRKGFTVLGFSGHSHTPFDPRFCMTEENTLRYRDEILRLKEVYRDRIRILCGLEYDYFSEVETEGYDYLIGSVHYVEKNGIFYNLDGGLQYFNEALRAFGGDIYGMIEEYYALAGQLFDKTHAGIIGHFDLVTKFNEGEVLFSQQDPRYQEAADAALSKLLQSGCVIEINTGAISRGYRTTPYPSDHLLREICRQGGKTILSSDCHQKENLDFGFEEMQQSPLWESVKKTLVQDPAVFMLR